MIAQPDPQRPPSDLLLIDVGNTTTTVGTWSRGAVRATVSVGGADDRGLLELLQSSWNSLDAERDAIACSVSPPHREVLERCWSQVSKDPIQVIGEALPAPIAVAIAKPTSVGIDRLCCAAAAYTIQQDTCMVVDCGTAITIDCVDQEGRFIGGAIAPGLALQAESLTRGTAQLPRVALDKPESPLGQDTVQALQAGIVFGAAGMIRELIERSATVLGRWPTVFFTGGDALLLAAVSELAEKVVPDLCLRGIALAHHRAYAGD